MHLSNRLTLILTTFLYYGFSETLDFESSLFSWTKELHKELFHLRQYEKNVRPVAHNKERTVVDLQFSFTHTRVNEKERTFEVNGWIGLRWVDKFMNWNPSSFGNVPNAKIFSELLWKPDIVVLNSIQGYETLIPSQSILLYDGTVYYIPRLFVTIPCDFDVLNWPEGQQNCEIRFGAWTYDSSEIILSVMENQTKADLKHYTEGSQPWQLEDATVMPKSFSLDQHGFIPDYQEVVVTLKLKRLPTLQEKFAIGSSVVLATNWMSPHSSSRLTAVYSGFLGMALLLIYFLQKLPVGKNIPIIVMALVSGHIVQRRDPIPHWAAYVMKCQIFGNQCSNNSSNTNRDTIKRQINDYQKPHGDIRMNASESETVGCILCQNCYNSPCESWGKIAMLSDRLTFFLCIVISIFIIIFLVV